MGATVVETPGEAVDGRDLLLLPVDLVVADAIVLLLPNEFSLLD